MNLRIHRAVIIGKLVLISSACTKEASKSKTSKAMTSHAQADETSQQTSVGQVMVPVKRMTLEDTYSQRGKLQAAEQVELRADKQIRIGPPKAKQYEFVKRGQLLFEVDTKELEQKRVELRERLEQIKLELNTLATQVQFSSRQFERKSKLSEKGIAPQRELDQASKELVEISNQHKTKQLDFRKTTRELDQMSESLLGSNFLSPIDGVLQFITAGQDEVQAGDLIAKVVNPEALSLYLAISQDLAARLKPGFTVRVQADVSSGQSINGTLESVTALSKLDGEEAQYEARVNISSSDLKRLKAKEGFEARAFFTFFHKKQALVIPHAAIWKSGNEIFGYFSTSKTGHPKVRAIKLGLESKKMAEILSGAKEGDYVSLIPRESRSQQ